MAEVDGAVVGHILFSPVGLERAPGAIDGMGLAPMAVLPEDQRQGVGSALVRGGLDLLRQRSRPCAAPRIIATSVTRRCEQRPREPHAAHFPMVQSGAMDDGSTWNHS